MPVKFDMKLQHDLAHLDSDSEEGYYDNHKANTSENQVKSQRIE